MTYLEARQYTSSTDMLASAKAIRQRMLNPIVRIRKPVEPVHINPDIEKIMGKYRIIVVKDETDLFPAFKGTAKEFIMKRAVELGISYDAVVGRSRERGIVNARHLLMSEVYMNFRQLSLCQIGKLFGGRDHTTTYHAVCRMGVHGKRGETA